MLICSEDWGTQLPSEMRAIQEEPVPTWMARCGLQMATSSWAKQLRPDSECVATTVNLRKLFSGGFRSKWAKDRLVVILLTETHDGQSQRKGVSAYTPDTSHCSSHNAKDSSSHWGQKVVWLPTAAINFALAQDPTLTLHSHHHLHQHSASVWLCKSSHELEQGKLFWPQCPHLIITGWFVLNEVMLNEEPDT